MQSSLPITLQGLQAARGQLEIGPNSFENAPSIRHLNITGLRVMEAAVKRSLKVVPVRCCVCGSGVDNANKVGRGYDYEYFTSLDEFDAYRCKECSNVYLSPRPDISEFQRIYPPTYHSLDFSEQNYSFVHNVRSRLEANRLLRYCEGIADDAKLLDVGCGDGFHLKLLKRYGKPSWTLEGIDLDSRAVGIASKGGLMVHQGTVEELTLGSEAYDLVYTIQTIEHVAHPDVFMKSINSLLKPGGRLVIVTDNTDSFDFSYFKTGYWGGYHFPRHWNLFNPKSLTRLAHETGFHVSDLQTIVSPVNWVYSIHNMLVDNKAPQWLIRQFTLKSPISLGIFTVLDTILQKFGKGALLNAFLTKPDKPPSQV
jgi:2-polyprenyl-3-methyl-5-hydroxy-6-metoxy-1,4-benzoquinol methylase